MLRILKEEMDKLVQDLSKNGHMSKEQIENLREGTKFNINFEEEMKTWPSSDVIESKQKGFKKTKNPRLTSNNQKFTYRFIVTL